MVVLQAQQQGIVNEDCTVFLSTATNKTMRILDALEIGLITFEAEKLLTAPPTEVKTFVARGVFDQVQN
jgi:hypothetical protein